MTGIQISHKSDLLDVEVQLPSTGVTAIIGPSGVGKTTLLRYVAGFDHSTFGKVSVNNEVWQDSHSKFFVPTHKRAIGMVFQEASLFPHLTVHENIKYGFKRAQTSEILFDLDEVVRSLGLGDLLGRNPVTLSGGERQRVAIARAVASQPRLLLMDEPMASLDAKSKSEILPYLERLCTSLSIPVLYVTHSMPEVTHLADHVVALASGKVHFSGALEDAMLHTELFQEHPEDVGAVLDVKMVAYDSHYQLAHMEFAGQTLWVPMRANAQDRMFRIYVRARDVSIARSRPTDSSVLNVLPVNVDSVREEPNGVVIVVLNASGHKLLARITKKSWDHLLLEPGQQVFALVKGVAILD